MPTKSATAPRATRVDRRKVRAEVAAFDWSKIDALTDFDIARQIAGNPEAPPMLSADDVRDLLVTGRARVTEPLDVRAIRLSTGLSQDRFAATFGVSAASLRNWEQGRRQPEGAARVLLTVIAREPQAVMRALGIAPDRTPAP